MNFFERISAFLSHNLAAGIAGGLVYAIVTKEGSILEKISAVLVGGLTAHYAMPFVLSWGGASVADSPFFWSFLVGGSGWLTANAGIKLLAAFVRKPFLPSPTSIAAFLEAYNSRTTKKTPDDKSNG